MTYNRRRGDRHFEDARAIPGALVLCRGSQLFINFSKVIKTNQRRDSVHPMVNSSPSHQQHLPVDRESCNAPPDLR